MGVISFAVDDVSPQTIWLHAFTFSLGFVFAAVVFSSSLHNWIFSWNHDMENGETRKRRKERNSTASDPGGEGLIRSNSWRDKENFETANPVRLNRTGSLPDVNILSLNAQFHKQLSPEEDAAAMIERLMQSRGEMSVPTVLRHDSITPSLTQDEAILEWLRENFTNQGPSKRVPRLKSVSKGICFAIKMKRAAKKHVTSEESKFSTPEEACANTVMTVTEDERMQICEALKHVSDWDFDVWKFRELTHGQELQTLGWHILHLHDIQEVFHTTDDVIVKWLNFVASQYMDNPYHSATHAADVLQAVNYFLTVGGASKYLAKIEVLSMLLAAIVHDMGHDGLNNNFHKNSRSERALSFNDESIQEQYHISTLFMKTFANPGMNIFENLSDLQLAEVRRMMIKMVLDTDMSKHFTHMASFRTLLEQKDSTEIIMSTVLHFCGACSLRDISNPMRCEYLSKIWAERVMEEFFRQGDKEMELGIPVSPNCNRHNTSTHTTQIGFINFIVLDSCEIMKDFLPVVGEICLPELRSNLRYWQSFAEPAKGKEE
ncbi:hypothetical protein GUITHDRAFT_141617 [Guillardia theta CCMP2712]|uniref:Phosphodiesterase n=1 Tax=Guillardia theta (strain CCMP2712) TaxID=905079 RepID=L1J055_GUITC|nr:hypothetical protein GUITHDRAFT_141617 [Guillardia theta CCMP2712]EKX41861.1 hypothetical protein GUITHDRAFT_141617 [Guillardia theta CCMP2712]|eukprot:XP_005828841.1 hypothetical protein GUITHDRAFT_141617 [Guillardia theta CCMP2712]